MSILDIFKKKEKVDENYVEKINLSKEEVHKVCLTKKPLQNLTSRVALVLDYSGSMDWQYKNGTVQSVLEKIFPIALEFDDNGQMECWLFHDTYKRLPDVNINNINNYVKNHILKHSMGGTKYSVVMKDIFTRYIKEEPSKLPNYVVFITDGDCFEDDKNETTNVIKTYSKYPIFWQFVGLGTSKFAYLEKLDDLTDRYVDNADFFSVEETNEITYNKLLNEYPSWLENDKVKDMLK